MYAVILCEINVKMVKNIKLVPPVFWSSHRRLTSFQGTRVPTGSAQVQTQTWWTSLTLHWFRNKLN